MDTSIPIAWQRKWDFDGETPKKERNENGRMAWPSKFKFLPVTKNKCLADDVPLYYRDALIKKANERIADLENALAVAYNRLEN